MPSEAEHWTLVHPATAVACTAHTPLASHALSTVPEAYMFELMLPQLTVLAVSPAAVRSQTSSSGQYFALVQPCRHSDSSTAPNELSAPQVLSRNCVVSVPSMSVHAFFSCPPNATWSAAVPSAAAEPPLVALASAVASQLASPLVQPVQTHRLVSNELH